MGIAKRGSRRRSWSSQLRLFAVFSLLQYKDVLNGETVALEKLYRVNFKNSVIFYYLPVCHLKETTGRQVFPC